MIILWLKHNEFFSLLLTVTSAMVFGGIVLENNALSFIFNLCCLFAWLQYVTEPCYRGCLLSSTEREWWIFSSLANCTFLLCPSSSWISRLVSANLTVLPLLVVLIKWWHSWEEVISVPTVEEMDFFCS